MSAFFQTHLLGKYAAILLAVLLAAGVLETAWRYVRGKFE